ncbi:MAG: Asp23/Gls24 family envelope stress response protein [Clostridiales bacterium]|nr:Asp23/Gls24 family envelope stress response protein [Clostridiales bacterium]
MAAKTSNIYGKIVVSDSSIERFVSRVAMDCYGIVELVPKNFSDSIISFLKFRSSEVKGVSVHSNGDRMTIDVAVVIKYGVSIKAVSEALKESIKYKTEKFTGMIVDVINVKVMGVKL